MINNNNSNNYIIAQKKVIPSINFILVLLVEKLVAKQNYNFYKLVLQVKAHHLI